MPELLRLEHFGFTYPQQPRPALADVSLTVRQGEFWVLCGASGCGKTTLLRQLKPALRPHGAAEGCILFDGQPLDDLPPHRQAADIGFVLQSPEEQTVTDKVWHELAFGLESLGCDTPSIRRRVAEMASFFGIQDWFHRKVDELSGGQKQLLALASVMVLQPKIEEGKGQRFLSEALEAYKKLGNNSDLSGRSGYRIGSDSYMHALERDVFDCNIPSSYGADWGNPQYEKLLREALQEIASQIQNNLEEAQRNNWYMRDENAEHMREGNSQSGKVRNQHVFLGCI